MQGSTNFFKAGITVLHRHRIMRRLLTSAILLCGMAVGLTWTPTLCAQSMMRESLIGSESSSPITLSADQISAWNEDGLRVYLLRGGVIVSQASALIRTPSAVVWVEEQVSSMERSFFVTVYGEQPIHLERSGSKTSAEFGFIRMKSTHAKI